jgi:hypothetical protein
MDTRGPLHILVATGRTQGRRANDFCYAREGELVRTQLACGKDRGDPDGPCGCLRSLSGEDSMRATTTVRVASFPGDREGYVARLTRSWNEAGWTSTRAEDVAEGADLLLAIAARYPLDTVLEWRDGSVAVRHDAMLDGWGEGTPPPNEV